MFDNSKYKNDLKIVVDNTSGKEAADVLILESGDLVEEMDENPALFTVTTTTDADSGNEQIGSSDVHAVEMQCETEETEFHVNLDKVPLSLKNTVLASKVYINDSFDKIQVEEKTINEIDLKSLYLSLQIDEESFVESTFNVNYFRRDALHLIGVNEMSTDEVFEYFNSYKPFSIEWINDNVCNVVWKDSYLMTLALIDLSKSYGEEEGLEKSGKAEEEGSGIEADAEVRAEDEKIEEQQAKLPPGRWRVGNAPAKKGNQLFLRYARINDKKQKGAESRSEYYRKYGNPNYGNLRGLISTSKRTKLKATVFNKLNGDIEEDQEVFEATSYDDDTWGTRSSKEILTRIRMPNEKERSDVNNNEKSQRKMRMYIDDYDEKESMKRKRNNDDDSNSESDSDEHKHRRSRSPKIIRKPVDARSYLELKKSSRSDHHRHHHDSKRTRTDLRDTLKHKHRR